MPNNERPVLRQNFLVTLVGVGLIYIIGYKGLGLPFWLVVVIAVVFIMVYYIPFDPRQRR